MDWIHCNDCYKQPYSSPNTSFVLTSCARIQCSECNTSNSCVNKDCKPCRSQNYSAVPLDDSMPSAVEDFFRDPLDHLKRFLKVYDFQRNHRERLLKHQAEEQKQMTIQASQLMKTNTELKNQLQKYRSETNDVKEENLVLRSKIQELQSCLEKERRPLATELYQHGTSGSSEPKKRKCPSPTINGAPGIRTTIPWQPKIPDPPNRVGVPTRQQRFIPTAPKQQPYKTQLTQQFLNPETPAYFPSYSSSTPNARSNNTVTPRIPAAAFPTPIHRPRHSVMAAPANQLGINSRQQQLPQQQKRNHTYNNRVYAFMSEAARQALTPEAPK